MIWHWGECMRNTQRKRKEQSRAEQSRKRNSLHQVSRSVLFAFALTFGSKKTKKREKLKRVWEIKSPAWEMANQHQHQNVSWRPMRTKADREKNVKMERSMEEQARYYRNVHCMAYAVCIECNEWQHISLATASYLRRTCKHRKHVLLIQKYQKFHFSIRHNSGQSVMPLALRGNEQFNLPSLTPLLSWTVYDWIPMAWNFGSNLI